jgi:hypothetical protein
MYLNSRRISRKGIFAPGYSPLVDVPRQQSRPR